MYKDFSKFRTYLAGLSPMQRLGLSAAFGSIGGFGIIISVGLASHVSGNRPHSNGQFPEPIITCTATIPATEAGGQTEVVFTGKSGGDGYSINTTGLRLTQQFEINGSMTPDVDTSRFEPDKYYSIDNSSVGENPSIDTLRNATLVVVEGGKFTHTGVPISCPIPGWDGSRG